MFATCSCPSLCKQSELQCWRRNRRLCEHKSPLQGSCLQPRVFKIKKSLCAVLSQITWQMWHRCKGNRADFWRRPGAKHCSSLCSQSEGGEYCGGQALKIQQSHAPERWSCSLRVRGPHFASKVSYNAGAATDDCASQCKSPLRGRYR